VSTQSGEDHFEAAAGFLAVHLTAYHGLLQNVVIRPGMRVLVHSAGGGVGSAQTP
jgi:synaptic vesicle membrane protein VAT-1